LQLKEFFSQHSTEMRDRVALYYPDGTVSAEQTFVLSEPTENGLNINIALEESFREHVGETYKLGVKVLGGDGTLKETKIDLVMMEE